jgi:1-acyl-sn-glycerol-3-phosphate acyltransferase
MEERVRACIAVGLTLGMSELGVLSLAVDHSGVTIRKVARRWGQEMVSRLGIDLRVRGGEDVDWTRPLVVMANHNSHLDIPILYASLPRSFGMLAKSGLFRFPIFGRAMTGVGCVAIDRDNKSSAHASIQRAAAQVRAGDGIVVFPEGTRGNGQGIRSFKKGPFHLALAAGVSIVPVGVRGTAAICPRDRFTVFPGVAEVTIGSPIAHGDAGARSNTKRLRELADTVRAEIAHLSGLPLVDD